MAKKNAKTTITVFAKATVAVFTPEEIKFLTRPVLNTWSAIGHDLYEMDPEISNEDAVECVIDADRMEMHGGADGHAANLLVRERVMESGYTIVLNALADNFVLA